MISVCDAIMGSGKTSAAVNMILEAPHRKYIYVTPYKTGCESIIGRCAGVGFKWPTNDGKRSKDRTVLSRDVANWIAEGESIVMTHELFAHIGEVSYGDIKRHGYTLILDEAQIGSVKHMG